MIITTLVFIALCLLFGSLPVIYSLRGAEHLWVRLGTGLALLPVTGVILNLLHLPIHLTTYFMSGLAVLILSYLYRVRSGASRPEVSTVPVAIHTILVLLFLGTFIMYLEGAFSYSYMEDGDSWDFTAVAKIISENRSFSADYRYNHYSEPYTQGYQIVLGLLHQANDSIYWTVKYFNALFAALSIPFFFFFAREIFANSNNRDWIALSCAVMIFVVPSWLTHHIYSMTLNATLLPLLFYTLLKLQRRAAWAVIAGLVLGSMVLNHFFTAFVTCLLIGFLLLLVIIHGNLRSVPYGVVVMIASIVASLFYIPAALVRHGYYLEDPAYQSHGGVEMAIRWLGENELVIAGFVLIVLTGIFLGNLVLNSKPMSGFRDKRLPVGTAMLFITMLIIFLVPEEPFVRVRGCCSEVYNLSDFLFPQAYNLMHNPKGWGWVYTLLVVAGILFVLFEIFFRKRAGFGLYAVLCLFVLTFLMVHGMRLSFGMMTFRMWTFMTLFASILSGYGLFMILHRIMTRNRIAGYLVMGLSILGITSSSFAVKLDINTMPWPDHQILFDASHEFHARLRDNLDENTSVLNLCRDSGYLISYDLLPPIVDPAITPPWRQEHEPVLFEKSHFLSAEDIARRLREMGVPYAIAGFSCVKDESEREKVIALVRKFRNSDAFRELYVGESDILFEVVSSDEQ